MRTVVRRTVLVGAVAALGAVFLRFADFTRTMSRLETIGRAGVASDESIVSRTDAFWRSAETFARRPLLGAGFQGWQYGLNATDIGLHSSIVDVPAQLGVLGLFGYFGTIVFPLVAAVRLIRSRGTTTDVAWHRGAAMGLSAFFVGSVLNPVFLMPTLSETLALLGALAVCDEPTMEAQ